MASSIFLCIIIRPKSQHKYIFPQLVFRLYSHLTFCTISLTWLHFRWWMTPHHTIPKVALLGDDGTYSSTPMNDAWQMNTSIIHFLYLFPVNCRMRHVFANVQSWDFTSWIKHIQEDSWEQHSEVHDPSVSVHSAHFYMIYDAGELIFISKDIFEFILTQSTLFQIYFILKYMF